MEQNKARLRLYIQSSDTRSKQSSEMPRRARKELAIAIGIREFAAIIAVAALMVIGVACGNGAEPTSLSDEVPTPAPPTVGGKTPTAPIVSPVDRSRTM